MLVMPRPFTREGIETRLAIRKAFEANPALSHPDLRRQFNVLQTMVDSALGRTAAEWQALLDATPASNPRIEKDARAEPTGAEPARHAAAPTIAAITMPGLEQGIVKFTRKPAKMARISFSGSHVSTSGTGSSIRMLSMKYTLRREYRAES